MQRAHMTELVWQSLLGLKAGRREGPAPGWTREARAAWALYAPLMERAARRPFLFAQVGQSLDGRIATLSGDATAISGPDGLRHLHRCRALADAVVVGVRTALADNPRLSVRLVDGPSPARVVIDPRGRLPDDAALLDGGDGARRRARSRPATGRGPPGIEVVRLPAVDGWIAPADIHAALGELGFERVLVEGGGITIAGFLEAGLLQRLHVAIAPLIIGAGPLGAAHHGAGRPPRRRPPARDQRLRARLRRGLRLRAGAAGNAKQVDVADRRRPLAVRRRLKPRLGAREAGLGRRRGDPLGERRAERARRRRGATGSARCAPRSRAGASAAARCAARLRAERRAEALVAPLVRR